MKKFISIAAALATALSSSALYAGAMFEHIPSTRIWDEEFEIFDAMDNGGLVIDIDEDGSFTLTDCYLLYGFTCGYETSLALAEYCDSVADYDGSGKVDFDDTEHLIRYYIVNNKMSREITKSDYYDSITKQFPAESEENGMLSGYVYDLSQSKNFARELLLQSDYLMAGYPVFCDILENGEIDYDIDGDGRLWFDDINYLWVYNTNESQCAYMDFTMAEAAQVPGDMQYPCQKLENYLRRDLGITWVWEYALMYCFENYGEVTECMNNDYYEGILEGSGKYDFGRYAKQCYEDWFPKNDYLSFNGAMFNREYIKFLNDKADDLSYIPDTNGDGVLDIYDTFNSYIYLDDLRADSTAETTILPADVWTFFKEGCDLNENGLSGDYHDLSMLNLFVLDRMENSEYIEMFDNYQEKIKVYIEKLSDDSGVPAVKYSPEKYSSPVALDDDAERTGDSNADGEKDMADVVFIMQSLANPNEYKLSAIGRFNADIYNTGDGVTLMDAQAIQNSLLGIA